MRIPPARPPGPAIALNLLCFLLRLAPRASPQCPPPARRPPRASPASPILPTSTAPTRVAATPRSFAALPGARAGAAEVPRTPGASPGRFTVLSLRPQPHRHPRGRSGRAAAPVALGPTVPALPGLLRRMRDALEATSVPPSRWCGAVGTRRPRCLSLEVEQSVTARYGHAGRMTKDPPLGVGASSSPPAFPSAPRPPLSPTPCGEPRALRIAARALLEDFGVKLEVLPRRLSALARLCQGHPRCFGTGGATPRASGRALDAAGACGRSVPPPPCPAQLGLLGPPLAGGWHLLGAVAPRGHHPPGHDVTWGVPGTCPRPLVGKVVASGGPWRIPRGFPVGEGGRGGIFPVLSNRPTGCTGPVAVLCPARHGHHDQGHVVGPPAGVEFPSAFLVPLGMPFAGGVGIGPKRAPRLPGVKFGPGAIENPEYPNPELKGGWQGVGNKTGGDN
ncbi:ribitol 5-phosphate transferase FKRP-like [Zonotrichia leucophrys gambelii]|uniref:ribitol 5-phosphate transferase FKRP-like n=1 Tax=Zonotrichia leucophrys gambelii TaxID=257770 RepID=UPI003140086F